MRRISLLSCSAALIFAAAAASFGIPRGPEMTEQETTAIKACQGIVHLFERSAGRIWPGFDLSRRPFLVYIPGRWGLLLNPPEGAKEFGPLPANWPPLGIRAGYFPGQYRDLVGQFALDLEVGGAKIVALGLLEGQFEAFGPKTPTMLGFIVHEAFHQYQNEAFGEIPWEREKRYPILDADNTGLAALEMRILADAVSASLGSRRGKAEELIRMFVAVRIARWEKSPPFVSRYEQGQEVREGTAAYVEKKSLELARGLESDSALKGTTTSRRQDFEPVSVTEIFRKDFEGRTTGGAVSPDDMIRNRIYPVGSALGFLADLWGSGWKQDLVRAVGTFTFHGYFKDKRVAFFTPSAPAVILDGKKRTLGRGPDSLPFREIELIAPNLALTAKIPGVLKVENGRLILEFLASAAAK